MAIINPDGLFHGDRLRRCSDSARLYWPYLFLAANGFGRLEINYRRIAAAVFVDFKRPPTEEEFYAVIQEYKNQHLLFLYECNGQVWGQWDCRNEYLPRWKTVRDRQSPDPPPEQYEAWKKAYRAQSKPLPKISEIFRNLPKSSETFGNFPSGKGLGLGREETTADTENSAGSTSSQQNGDVFSLSAETQKPPNHWKTQKFNEFWAVVWAKIGRGDAERAWRKVISNVTLADTVIAAAKTQGPALLDHATKYKHSILHPATWLNGQRWGDELAAESDSDSAILAELERRQRDRAG